MNAESVRSRPPATQHPLEPPRTSAVTTGRQTWPGKVDSRESLVPDQKPMDNGVDPDPRPTRYASATNKDYQNNGRPDRWHATHLIKAWPAKGRRNQHGWEDRTPDDYAPRVGDRGTDRSTTTDTDRPKKRAPPPPANPRIPGSR